MPSKLYGFFAASAVWLGLSGTAEAAPPAGETTVYLHRHGGVVRGGPENGPASMSAVVGTRGLKAIQVPAYSGSDARWNSLVRCVDQRFSDYRVRIVDERPSRGPYITTMIGGDPSMLRLPPKIGGIAPYNGKLIDRAMVFVFDEVAITPSQQCIATAHEIGHALGLDHTTLCSDIMSYADCGPKSFRDRTASCGEYGERRCTDGSHDQNTHERLALAVGLRPDAEPVAPEPVAPEPEPSGPRLASQTPGQTGRDHAPPRRASAPVASLGRPAVRPSGAPEDRPRLRVLEAPADAQSGSTYRVRLQTRDDDGIAKVELVWADGRTTRRIRCGDRSYRDVTCSRRGLSYEFAIRSSSGARRYAVVVTDGRGHTVSSPLRSVRFRS